MSKTKTNHRLILGDSRIMDSLDTESVHLVITSPPYWQLKDYGVEGQIGFDDSYEDYINNLNLVWQECFRVLHRGCRLCVNIGDQFARSVYYGRYKVIPIRTEIIKFCEAIGMDYMGAVIWQKVTTTNTTGGATIMGSFPYPRNGILKLDYEFILLFKKLGDAPKPTLKQKNDAKMSTEEWNQYFAGHWNFSGERQEGHIARFPVELPHRLIRMFSFPGENVLDPFLGSGTTSVAAARLERNSVGFEMNPDFMKIAEDRLHSENNLTSQVALKVEKSKTLSSSEASERIQLLPHVFHDEVKMNKKVDPRNLTFGSKITGKESTDKGVVVKRIIEPDEIEIEGGQRVKLLGVVPISAKHTQAMDYMSKNVLGNRLTLKFDREIVDSTGRLLAYAYLPNKTFVNGHLLKDGLVGLDTNLHLLRRASLQRFVSKGAGIDAR